MHWLAATIPTMLAFMARPLASPPAVPVARFFCGRSVSIRLVSRPSENLASLTVKELQQRLRAKGLAVSGRKGVLIDRILSDATGPVAARPPEPPAVPAAAPPPAHASSTFATAPDALSMDETPRRAAPASTLRVVSWNIAGLRGLLKREAGLAALRALVEDERADVILLQETKLQEMHVESVEPLLLEALGPDSGHWRAAWSCSTARKGYSGVCTLWSDRMLGAARAAAATCAPMPVDADSEADREGRTLLLNLPLAEGAGAAALAEGGRPHSISLVNVYTPNSGAELARLEYRTGASGWDEKFLAALVAAQAAGASAVCVGGDLNVAAEAIDYHNPHEPRMALQAGTTPEEQASFRRYAEPPLRLADGFRARHPGAAGQFTYWSQRARNRPRNRGLRIDYFLLDEALQPSGQGKGGKGKGGKGEADGGGALVDVQHLQTLEGSDHCPLLLLLDLGALS
jgi:exodeoxyribonuclease III